MTETEAIQELYAMSHQELDMVPYIIVKLVCRCKGCKRYTQALDYGIFPVYYHRKMRGNPWHNVQERFFVCKKHWGFYEKMVKLYGADHTQRRIVDLDKLPLLICRQQ